MPNQVLSERVQPVDAPHVDVLEGSLLPTERRLGERLRRLPSTRERKRSENRGRYSDAPGRGLVLEFQCECVRPNCSARLPLEVERHRRSPNRYIVCVAHADADIAVGVADRFLVVETHGITVAAHTRPSRTNSTARGRPSAA